jgi:hypothetical protein
MGVPDYQSLMRPVLAVLADGQVRTARELRALVAAQVGLSADDQAVMLPSGAQTLLANRIGWAVTYMAKANVVDRPRRGVVRITDRGRQLLAEHPERVDVGVLGQFAEFEAFRAASRRDGAASLPVAEPGQELTPTEQVGVLIERMDAQVADELLVLVHEAGPVFLERLALRLLAAMAGGRPATVRPGTSSIGCRRAGATSRPFRAWSRRSHHRGPACPAASAPVPGCRGPWLAMRRPRAGSAFRHPRVLGFTRWSRPGLRPLPTRQVGADGRERAEADGQPHGEQARRECGPEVLDHS